MEFGKAVNYFSESVDSDSKVICWQLHGSCNFLPSGMNASRGVSFSAGVSFGTGIKVSSSFSEVTSFCNSNTSFYPAMAIYVKDKPMQFSKESIVKVQELWKNAVSSVSNIVVIGVNPNPDDKHIWDILANASGKLIYVGNKKNFNNWKSTYRGEKESIFLGETFASCLDSIVENL